MWYARDSRTRRLIEATPNANATCPLCEESVIPKCGDLVLWHFAHRSRENCDPWWEPESIWHRSWKALAEPANREVVIGNHRADIVSASGSTIVELQYSSISTQEIQEREQFYQRTHQMIWLFDVRDCDDRIALKTSKYRDQEVFGIWKWFKKSLLYVSAPLYLDLLGEGEPLLKVVRWLPRKQKFYQEGYLPQAFVARWVDRDDFVRMFITEHGRQLTLGTR